MKDLFFALGYDDLRLNIGQTGRELDIRGQHRLEPRQLVAECKGGIGKTGGADLNKFYGVLTRERTKDISIPISGYFVSLSGFTETGIEQEKETDDSRVILLDAERVITELERSRVLVNLVQAAERAGQCAQLAGLEDAAVDGVDLIGHDCGYVWAIYYSMGKQRTHYSLIHADGTPLAEAVAIEIGTIGNRSNLIFRDMQYLPPARTTPGSRALAMEATERYQRWLEQECGFIQLDGLPADTDLSATRLKLERLYVPMKAVDQVEPASPDSVDVGHAKTISIGNIMTSTHRLALLAVPGGGKSTLIKRLAIAFAFPERRTEVPDDLPQGDFLPLILRCRDLRDRARRPLLELLHDSLLHAGMTADEATAFEALVHEALRDGRAFLLIDGLDEISEESARCSFTEHLRSFLAMFPRVRLVVTSREAGFRLVAGVVASTCRCAKLAPLDEGDVHQLCGRWHREVVGDSERVQAEAAELASTIWNNGRIRPLAENPLLLTTLLVVKRWIGELPRSRTALYREAIRVLIRTWNVEGYDPLDEEETLTQLSFVACAMMEEGTQQIAYRPLLKLLNEARRELEPELHFAQISPADFIKRIEYRSSLLMQTGHNRADGELQPVYEFRHLTFQEYLAARGYVEEQYRGRDRNDSLADLLQPHFQDERWQEVIPLAVVLASRRAEETIRRLTMVCQQSHDPEADSIPPANPVMLLFRCLLDEVQVSPSTLRAALHEVGWLSADTLLYSQTSQLLPTKFGHLLQEVSENAYMSSSDGWDRYAYILAECADYEYASDGTEISEDVAAKLRDGLDSRVTKVQVRAALCCALVAFRTYAKKDNEVSGLFTQLRERLVHMLRQDNDKVRLAASWALAWIGERRLCNTGLERAALLSVYSAWRNSKVTRVQKYAAWAFSAQPLLHRDAFGDEDWGDTAGLNDRATVDRHWPHLARAILAVQFYRRVPFSDSELAGQLKKLSPAFERDKPTVVEMLENLGPSGQKVLQEWQRKSEESIAELGLKASNLPPKRILS
ncbi:MAG TPA: NACHT domain-containing protein [Armatimonadota bacterium]|nr:NACHT domain-containing protein [Armatimonadota bacterium]